MTNGNGWRAEPHGNQYLISNGPEFVLAAGPHDVLAMNGNKRDEPFKFHTGDDTWQWTLARLNDKPGADAWRVDRNGHVWLVEERSPRAGVREHCLTNVGRIESTGEDCWEAFAANKTLLRHWHGWDAQRIGYADPADAARAAVQFHAMANQSEGTALATGSVSAETEEGPWRVKWSRATGKTRLVLTSAEGK